MTNKIEKLNAAIKKSSYCDHLVLDDKFDQREIDIVKRICDKIDEVIDEVNPLKNVTVNGTPIALYYNLMSEHIHSLSVRIDKLEATQRQQRIDKHHEELSNHSERKTVGEGTLPLSDPYPSWAMHPAKTDCKNFKCKFYRIFNICGHDSPTITLCDNVGICYSKEEKNEIVKQIKLKSIQHTLWERIKNKFICKQS